MTDSSGLIDAADIDISNLVLFSISNPDYKGEWSNHIDLGYRYPEEKLHMIGIIKMVVRCGLEMSLWGCSKEALDWVNEYYKYYTS